MLEELDCYENLGTPGFFWELLNSLQRSDAPWSEADIRAHFFNRIVDGKSVFDGCMPLAMAVGVIAIGPDGRMRVDEDFSRFLISEKYMRGKLLERLFGALRSDDSLGLIFAPEHVSYDVVYKLIQIENGAFGFRHVSLREFLVSFGFLDYHPDPKIRRLVVHKGYRKLFDSVILPETESRKIGIEELERSLGNKRKQGLDAEELIVSYEKSRLAAHPRVQDVQRISDYDVGAGYDVVSYDSESSDEYDRFIEVKSCSTDRRFYWSRNEVAQARIKRKSYYLYLVDSVRMHENGYVPVIIQDPFENVFQSDAWAREEQSWLFQPLAT